jgi:histidinol-phosphatase
MSEHELLTFALRLAQVAEQQIMPRYRRCAVRSKPDGSDVTEADIEAEKAMRAVIASRYPDHDVLGEELGGELHSDRRHRWVLDPIDGTVWFALGLPTFGTLIALLEDEQPIVGVAHFPALGETLYAAKGEGCWFKHPSSAPVRVQVARAPKLTDAFVSASGVHASDIHNTTDRPSYNLTALIHAARRFKFVGDCLQHGLVCQGRVHAAIDAVMKPWDIAALVPCVEEAGGVVSSLSGERDGVVYAGSLVTSCGKALHEEIIARLSS